MDEPRHTGELSPPDSLKEALPEVPSTLAELVEVDQDAVAAFDPAVFGVDESTLEADGAEGVTTTSRWRERKQSIPTRLWWALAIVVLYHGGLLLFGSFTRTYDAYVHIFLGDHYARDWFSTWDQRWYTGFTTVSYPPGTHMATAAVSKLVGDLEIAFAFLQLATLMNLTVGIYRFSRIWVDKEAAANASLLLACSSAIAETIHVFGQLPTIWAIGFLLNALPFMHDWIHKGRWTDFILGTSTLAACTAGHHVTTLFGSVFFLGPIVAWRLLAESRIPVPDEPPQPRDTRARVSTMIPLVARRIRRAGPACVRTAVMGVGILGALVVVVLPYWLWSVSDPITQIPIPHGSRGNFLEDANLGLVFFVIPWGLMIIVLPYALVVGMLDGKWPLSASIGLLSLLGTGGTTPIPRMLLGHAFDVLTLDRFTFWATIQILPLAGMFVTSLERRSVARWLTSTGGPLLAAGARVFFVAAMVVMSLFSATLTWYRPFQPDAIDPDPIVAFIEKDDHDRWRFLTLGFGDQMAWLSAQTTAAQVDGNYHSVRRLPELTSTSVERLEGAKYRGISGLGSLQQFLEVPEKYHLKFVFSNDQFYDPLLHFLGWQSLLTLENGIVVWERGDIEPLPAQLPVREVPLWQRLLWGLAPPVATITALHLLVWHAVGRPGQRRHHDVEAANRAILVGPFAWLDAGLWWLQRNIHLAPHRPPTLANSGTEKNGSAEDGTEKNGPAEDGTEKKGPAEDGTGGDSPERPHWTERLAANVRGRVARDVGMGRRLFRLAVMAFLISYVPVQALFEVTETAEATEVVENYYDHLDWARWTHAYDQLDPLNRPDYELWRLQRSVRGGMLQSYAKLSSLDVEVVETINPDRLVVEVDLMYLTALDWHPASRTHTLNRRDGVWYLEADPTQAIIPPDQFTRRAGVDYVIQGRRRVTSDTTELADVQDRPELVISESTLIEVDGLPTIVGVVENVDVDPADLTLTGVLRGADDEILARYNATEPMLRTLRPRESTPFLIEFEEVAAGTDLDFDPFDFNPIQLDEEILEVEVYAKAVVTTGGLYRGLGVNDARVVKMADGGYRLVGELRNDGVVEGVVPRVLVSFLDDDGTVLWVQNHYLDYSVRSQRTGPFTIDLDDISDHKVSPLEVELFFNGVSALEEAVRTIDLVDGPSGAPWAALRIDVSAYLGPGP